MACPISTLLKWIDRAGQPATGAESRAFGMAVCAISRYTERDARPLQGTPLCGSEMLGPGVNTADQMVTVSQLKWNDAGRMKRKTPCGTEAARGFPCIAVRLGDSLRR